MQNIILSPTTFFLLRFVASVAVDLDVAVNVINGVAKMQITFAAAPVSCHEK